MPDTIENKFVKMPIRLFEGINERPFTPRQLKIIYAIWRLQLGTHQEQVFIKAQKDLAAYLDMDFQHLNKILRGLIDDRVILRAGKFYSVNQYPEYWNINPIKPEAKRQALAKLMHNALLKKHKAPGINDSKSRPKQPNKYDQFQFIGQNSLKNKKVRLNRPKKDLEAIEAKNQKVGQNSLKKSRPKKPKNETDSALEPLSASGTPKDSIKDSKDIKILKESNKIPQTDAPMQEIRKTIFSFWEQNVGILSPYQMEIIAQDIDDAPFDDKLIVLEALKIAVYKQANRPWDYTRGIINTWQRERIQTLEQLQNHQTRKENERNATVYHDRTSNGGPKTETAAERRLREKEERMQRRAAELDKQYRQQATNL